MATERQAAYLITGSSRGIGRALSEHYARAGARVYGFSRSAGSCEHENYRHVEVDIRDPDDVRRAIGQVISESGRIDILINNAGTKSDAYAMHATREQISSMVDTNFIGAFHVMRESLKLMKRNHFGRIISLSSVAVPLTSAGTSIYGASKAAVEHLMATMAREFARDNITFNTIGISSLEEGGMLPSPGSAAQLELDRALLKPASIELDELVHAIDYFASDLSRNVTGQKIYFGGIR